MLFLWGNYLVLLVFLIVLLGSIVDAHRSLVYSRGDWPMDRIFLNYRFGISK